MVTLTLPMILSFCAAWCSSQGFCYIFKNHKNVKKVGLYLALNKGGRTGNKSLEKWEEYVENIQVEFYF